MLSICVLFVVPVNAVQTGSEEDRFNLMSGNEIKNFEINEILLYNNETSDINGTVTNETTDLNSTVTDLNSTVGNCTNGTFVNCTTVNGTVGNVTNGTVDEEKLKEEKKTLKENIIGTLNNVGTISAVATGVLMTITTLLIAVPDPTWITKTITVGFAIGTAATAAVTIGCGIASIFVQWLM